MSLGIPPILIYFPAIGLPFPQDASSGNVLLPSKQYVFKTVNAANMALQPFFVNLFLPFFESF